MEIRLPPAFAALASLVLTIDTGCASARVAEFRVTRPALLDLRSTGNSLAVGTIDSNGQPQAAAEIAADLRTRIAQSLNPAVHLVSEGAGVVVNGGILEDSYEEHEELVSNTCYRTVDDPPDSNGIPQSHTETYDCPNTIRRGTGVCQLRFQVAASSGTRVLFMQAYRSDGEIIDASAEDVMIFRQRLRASIVEQFARVILPWQEVVSERLEDCDGDDRCKKGFELSQRGDLAGADALFSQVLVAYTQTGVVSRAESKRVAEALYDRGVIRAYQQRYTEGAADLQSALRLQPTRAKWSSKLATVGRMARDQQTLRERAGAPAEP